MVTNPKYSPRVAYIILDELKDCFQKEFGTKIASASEESLSKSSKKLLVSIAEKYVNPGNNFFFFSVVCAVLYN